jgi:16S rRNA (guanine527-N7)-methyltransferase
LTPWELLAEGANGYGADLSADQVGLFRHYSLLLQEWNERVNLTRITGERDVVLKHFLDSLAFLVGVPETWQDRPLRLIDVGSGAGFPGIPLLIARPTWSGVLLEATRKKVTFLDAVISELGLSPRVKTHWGRAEEASKTGKGQYDLVTARAVAELSKLVDWTMSFLPPGGLLLASKGPRGPKEAKDAAVAIQKAGGTEPELREIDLPEGVGKRILVKIHKTAKRK